MDRRTIGLVPADLPHGQIYHAVRKLSGEEAEVFIRNASANIAQLAENEIRGFLAELDSSGHRIDAFGVVLGNTSRHPSLAETQKVHAAMHAAEGELYRGVLVEALDACGFAATGIRERELYEVGAEILHVTEGDLRMRLTQLGKPLGAPWTAEHKAATLAAWIALTGTRAPGARTAPRTARRPR